MNIFNKLAVVLLFSGFHLVANAILAEGLLRACKSGDAFCGGYIWSYVDQARTNVELVKSFCIPSEVSLYQSQRVVEKYIESHPEKLHQVAWVTVHTALMEAFPCKVQ